MLVTECFTLTTCLLAAPPEVLMEDAGRLNITGLPLLELFGLCFSVLFYKFRFFFTGILATLSGILSLFWTIALLKEEHSVHPLVWNLILGFQWIFLLLALFRRRPQKR